MKGVLAARSVSLRHSLRMDSELIYSLFPFHLITVAAILSILFTFTIYSSESFLLNARVMLQTHLPAFNTHMDMHVNMCTQTRIITTTKLFIISDGFISIICYF